MKSKALPFPIGRTELVIMMASLMSLNALAIDIMLPALGLISDDFGLTAVNDRQWTITSYIYGMAIGSILYGSLADRYGRRPVLLVTIGIYTGFGILCALAWTYELLLVGRFIQGLAAAALGVLANSIIRDRYDGDAMARAMSTIMMIFMIVPITAPLLGQLVLHVAPWKAIFLVLSAAGLLAFLWVMMRLPETLHPDNKTPIKFKSVTAAWYAVIFNRNSFGHVIASGLMMAPLFAYIASAQQIFFDIFDAGDIFVYIFALNAGAMSVASFTNSRIVMRFGARRVSQSALIFFILVSIIHFALAEAGLINIWTFTAVLVPSMGMVGFTGANFSSIAMQPFGRTAGVASSFQNFARSGLSAMIGAAIGLQFDGTVLPLATGFLVCGIASLLLIFWAEHGKLFRRVQTGVTASDLLPQS
ncbi:MAG: multidrug effflux MFS transporter [Sphingomonadales bacterium]|nr:multidrug effflux MFS transporter [Sphingomonadales bacterium]PIX66924.1 MAG: Bcr/CflA family drug resistance efflux transporter [Sphingomonadales bacterium CG_4_10_14_3_um_filter_58_15]NCO49294.1 multidrug effflux MFS transporter [Sphingomonadales bacterium]NCO99466.1 multidrug effflux MFS transporter [Sphingomonadales bacterium]NCP27824.1 multidrug effflux MFS transporter [Sphingomonadales bacterium]